MEEGYRRGLLGEKIKISLSGRMYDYNGNYIGYYHKGEFINDYGQSYFEALNAPKKPWWKIW